MRIANLNSLKAEIACPNSKMPKQTVGWNGYRLSSLTFCLSLDWKTFSFFSDKTFPSNLFRSHISYLFKLLILWIFLNIIKWSTTNQIIKNRVWHAHKSWIFVMKIHKSFLTLISPWDLWFAFTKRATCHWEFWRLVVFLKKTLADLKWKFLGIKD